MSRCSKRRGGAGPNRRGAFRVGNGLRYSPAFDASFRLFYPLDIPDGAVAVWPEKRAGKDATQAAALKQPTKALTSLGGYPGITSDGGDVLVAVGAGAELAGLASATIFAVLQDATAALLVALELTTNTTTQAGGFFIAPNNAVAGRMSVGVSGVAGSTTSKYSANTLAVPVVVTAGIAPSVSGAGAVVWMEFDGVDQVLIPITSASVAGLFSALDLHFFGRGTVPALPWPGTMGAFGIRAGDARDAGYRQALTWWGATVGKTL